MLVCAISKMWALGLAAAIGFCMISSPGCGSRRYEGPARAAVAGSVTLDGIPVDGGIINLIPLSSEGSRKPSAPVSKGHYDIPEEKGPNLGDYRVELCWLKPTGKKIQGNVADGPLDEMVETIPDKYNTRTTLRISIAAGKNKHDFALSAK